MNIRQKIQDRKLFFQFALLLTIISFAATFLLFSIFLLTGQSSSKGSAINVSGSLRMQSYVVALTVAESSTKDSRYREHSITAALDEFQKRLNSPGLVKGLPSNKSDPLFVLYNKIYKDYYNKLKPLAEEVIANPHSAETFLEFVPSFVESVDKFVFDIEQSLNYQMVWLRVGLIITCVVAFLVGIIFLFYFQHVFFKPILKLSEVASEVRRGNFKVRSDYSQENELGKFSDNLNFMIEDLSRLYSSLEDEVRKKTLDLNEKNKTINLLFRLRSIFSTHELSEKDLTRGLKEFLDYLKGEKIILLLKSMDGTLHISSVYPPSEHSKKAEIMKRVEALLPNFDSHKLASVRNHRLQIKIKTGSSEIGYLLVLLGEETNVSPEAQIFESVSEIFATALVNARKHEEGYRLALFEERSTIARELHDSIAQSLAFSRIQLTRLSFAITNKESQEGLNEIVRELKTGISTAYRQLREVLTAFRLKPTSSDLRQNIRSIMEEFHERSGISYKLKNDVMGFELGANKQVHLIHILREALTNIEKHSRATEAVVSLSIDSNNQINVTIADNGQGLSLKDKNKKGHFGLSIMEERANALNGKLSFEENSPKGLMVKLKFSITN